MAGGILELSQKRLNIFMVDPQVLQVEPGFNIRTDMDVDEIVTSIRAIGFRQDKPILVKQKGGEYFIRDGHRRHRAALKAIEAGVELSAIPVVLTPKGTNDVDDVVTLLTTSTAPLSPLDEAEGFKRLMALGLTVKEIHQRTGKKTSYIEKRLTLGGADKPVRDAVKAGAISVDTAAELVTLPPAKQNKLVEKAMAAIGITPAGADAQAPAKPRKPAVTSRDVQVAKKGRASKIQTVHVEAILKDLEADLEKDPENESLKGQVKGVKKVLKLAQAPADE